MIIFWGLVAVMVAVALGLILPPLVRRSELPGRDPQEAALSVYRQRVQELGDDLGRGSLTQAQFEEAREELETALAGDLPVETSPPRARELPRNWRTALAISVALPILSAGGYLWLGATDELATAMRQTEDEAERRQHLQEAISTIESRLRADPDLGEGWLLLGRTYLALAEPAKATAALAQAHRLLGDNPDLLVDYARAIASSHGGRLDGQALELIERALTLAPEHPGALWLAAAASINRGAKAEARGYLQRLAQHLPAGSEQERLARAQIEQLGEDGAGTSPGAKGAVRLEVQVILDKSLTERIGPDTTVFVFARATQGPRMPLAIARIRAQDLPATVVLDDSQAMTPEMRLSNFDEVVVGARASLSGEARAQSGDFEGYTPNAISLTESPSAPITVTIDRIVP
ncbi:MAG: c-type cytochrome biogenesis protein CcmI [Gammaproteobacteria bacterium]